MTSKQVMLTLVAALLCSCTAGPRRGADPLVSPYATRHVWAIAPLRNESGSLQVDGAALADKLAHHLENATNLDVVPVNRVLAAMEALQMPEVASQTDALKLLSTLGVDGLLIGTVTGYDPYDPPKMGMALELYSSARAEIAEVGDLRRLASAAVDRSTPADPRGAPPGAGVPPGAGALPGAGARGRVRQPVSVVSAFFDAADPEVRRKVQRYAVDRGATSEQDAVLFSTVLDRPDEAWRFYRINMDLYGDFVCYVMSWRVLKAETDRLMPPPATQPTR
jgi:hypothetical protein